jgi:hypothetical protein
VTTAGLSVLVFDGEDLFSAIEPGLGINVMRTAELTRILIFHVT